MDKHASSFDNVRTGLKNTSLFDKLWGEYSSTGPLTDNYIARLTPRHLLKIMIILLILLTLLLLLLVLRLLLLLLHHKATIAVCIVLGLPWASLFALVACAHCFYRTALSNPKQYCSLLNPAASLTWRSK